MTENDSQREIYESFGRGLGASAHAFIEGEEVLGERHRRGIA